MKKKYKKKIGILGGSFDPAHRGHIKISIEAKKKYKINKIIWAITKKNPFKSKSHFSLKKRIALSKKITKKHNFISIKFYEDKIKSNKTIDLVNYLKKKYKNKKIILSIDGTDIVKGGALKLQGYHHFLENCPEFRNNVILFEFLLEERSLNTERRGQIYTEIENIKDRKSVV